MIILFIKINKKMDLKKDRKPQQERRSSNRENRVKADTEKLKGKKDPFSQQKYKREP